MTQSGNVVDTDKDGFLILPERWSRSLAVIMAKEHGIEELDKKHWQIIDSLREYYKEFKALHSTDDVQDDMHREKFSIANLFPDMLVAWKISGLPKPGEEAKVYMEKFMECSDTRE